MFIITITTIITITITTPSSPQSSSSQSPSSQSPLIITHINHNIPLQRNIHREMLDVSISHRTLKALQWGKYTPLAPIALIAPNTPKCGRCTGEHRKRILEQGEEEREAEEDSNKHPAVASRWWWMMT
jgi:hypothetical protein